MNGIAILAATIGGMVGLEYTRRKGYFGWNTLHVPEDDEGDVYTYSWINRLCSTEYYPRSDGGAPNTGATKTSFLPVKVMFHNPDGTIRDITEGCRE